MSNIIEEIVSNRNWRVRELELLKKLKVNIFYSLDRKTNDQFFKMCIPYIYAHWEGFIVENFRLVIDYINKMELTEKELITELFVFSKTQMFRKLSGKQSFIQCCEFAKDFTNNLNNCIYIDNTLLSTKSNLKYEQLSEIFSWFKLDISECEKYKYEINKLVNLRNKIAHGENGISITYKEIENFIISIQELFDVVIVALDKYIKKFEFLKNCI